MDQLFADYSASFSGGSKELDLQKAMEWAETKEQDVDLLKFLFSCIDLTSLNLDDSTFSVKELCDKVNGFSKSFSHMPSVAAVCVYPVFAPVLKSGLNKCNVKKAVVSGGFPASQTFSDIKVLEAKRALDFGVDELDIVMSVGEFLDGNYEFILEEIKMVSDIKGSACLKVILETGLLPNDDEIWRASLLAMEGGADFIKTSTGKVNVSATPNAAYVMLHAIKSFYKQTKKKVGFKVSGGVVSSKDALVYYSLVNEILGDDWLNNKLFRIGASRLANNILSDVNRLEFQKAETVAYF